MKDRNDLKGAFSGKMQAAEGTANTYVTLIKALAVCFILSFIMILIYALILSFSSVSDAAMSKVTQTILIICVAISSAYGGKKTRKRGWLFGGSLGLIFAMLLIPFSMAFGQVFTFDIYLIAKLLVSAIVGAIGGIIGVNLN